jgi:hypothetical protein
MPSLSRSRNPQDKPEAKAAPKGEGLDGTLPKARLPVALPPPAPPVVHPMGRVTGVKNYNHKITDTPKFNDWFAGSKVVDGQGDPLLVFHGTGAMFRRFELQDFANVPGVFYFTSTEDHAWHYALTDDGRIRAGSHVKAIYLSIKNPLVVDFAGAEDQIGLLDEIEQAKADGRDGVIAKNLNDGYGVSDHYLVFGVNQIQVACQEVGGEYPEFARF